MPGFLPRTGLWAAAVALAAATLLLGCSFGRGTRTIDRTPAVDTGVGATIIYPGQGAPQLGAGAAGGSVGGQPSGAAPRGDSAR